MNQQPRLVTHSETKTARRCWRKWYLSEYRTLARRWDSVSESNLIGDLVHDALAEMYSKGQDPVAQVIYISSMMIQAEEDKLALGIGEGAQIQVEQNIKTIEECQSFAKIIVEGYMEWLTEEGEDQHLQLLSTEEEVSVPFPVESLGRPITLLAKLDARWLDKRSNARRFMDHKTVQNFSDRERWAHLDTQFYFYSLVDYLVRTMEDESAVGEWVDGGILNMLRKVKRTARSTPPYYKRADVGHSMIELTNYFTRLTGEIATIIQKEEMLDSGVGHHLACPPNPTRDCVWDCPYMTLCAFMDDGSDSEGYIEASFEVVNPLARYQTVTIR